MGKAGKLDVHGKCHTFSQVAMHWCLFTFISAVFSLSGAPDSAGCMDKTVIFGSIWLEVNRLLTAFLAQDPFIKITLHDGEFDNGGNHRGESVQTSVKNNAGGSATWNEKFVLNKPGVTGGKIVTGI
jgi:hypothetical protein